MTKISTNGHPTRPIEEFISLLKKNGVTRPIDICTFLRSRHNPQYVLTALETSLPNAGIKELIAVAGQSPSSIMCAEAVPRRCHRSLVVDGTKVAYLNDSK